MKGGVKHPIDVLAAKWGEVCEREIQACDLPRNSLQNAMERLACNSFYGKEPKRKGIV